MAEADVLAVEDTRRLHRLAQDLEVTLTGRVVTFHESVERARLPGLVAAMTDGATVLLITDAGMPSVSDPGYTLVRAALEAGVDVTAVPGPSAVVTALAVSGLPCDRFCFEGFLPRKAGERRARFTELAGERRTMVFFESPHRLADALADAAAVLGADRAAAVCRELTKTHEEIRRGPLASLAEWAADGVRGEITLVVAGAVAVPVELTADELADAVAEEEAAGATRKDAIRAVVVRTGLPRRTVYDAVVARKDASPPPA
jgi:16S rRNA (cytidine1402-2'-O)-methyltransferase